MKERDMREKKEIEELSDFFYSVDRTSYLGGPIRVMNYNALALACYDAGYRRQREGEWETIPHNPRGEMLNAYSHICKVEGCGYFYKDIRPYGYKFCPNCGAKMKGGAE